MSPFQATQADAFLGLNYGYVALTSLWVYDYILCVPDSVNFIINSRWGLGALFYLICSHLPFAYLFLFIIMIFQPEGTFTLCRFYAIANTYIGVITTLCAECIFVLRSIAVWEQKRLIVALQFSSIIAYIVPIIICFKQYSLASGECWIPGFVEYVDTKTSTSLIAVYCLAIVAELQILLLVLYRAAKSRGDRGIENRLMLRLVRDNLLYCICSSSLYLGSILAKVFLPFPATHLIAEYSTILQAIFVTRMHRDFWRSDRAFCGVDTDVSLTTWMAAAPDLVA